MRLNALNIDHYKDLGHGWEPYAAGEKTASLIIHLAEILDEMEPQGDDALHTIWTKVPRPTFRQFYDYYYEYDEPYKNASQKTISIARKDYTDAYPLPKVWYRVSIRHFTRNSGEVFYAFFVDNSYVFSINDINSKCKYEGTDLLDWAVSEAKAFVSEVRIGTYEKDILEKVPYIYREGKIKRSDLWEAYPESKKAFFSDYKKREIKKFCKYYRSGHPENAPLPEMTARIFFEACSVIYNSLGMHRETADYKFKESDAEREHYGGVEQTPKEQYYSLADGRDNGLKNVPMDDPLAFEEWDQDKGPYYEFNGSHPWEIKPSFSTLYSMHFMPYKNKDGQYGFYLSGSSDIRASETIIAANALHEAGYPVEVHDIDTIMARVEGTDYIPIIPIAESTSFSEGIHLPKGAAGLAVADKTVWMFDDYKMKC